VDLPVLFQEETPQPPWCKAAGLAFISLLLLLFHSRCWPLILITGCQSIDMFEIFVLGRSRPSSLPYRSYQLCGPTQHSFKLISGVLSESKADGDWSFSVPVHSLPSIGEVTNAWTGRLCATLKCRGNLLLLLPSVFISIS
jgi:hypothetical protein